MATIADLHRTAESRGDLRRFAGRDDLLRGLHQLVQALDKHNMGLDLVWRSGTRRLSARLSGRGRSYVREQWEDVSTVDERVLSGIVVGLSLGEDEPTGTFDLKQGRSARRSIQADRSVVRTFELGTAQHVLVAIEHRVNHAGLPKSPLYRYIGPAPVGAQPALDDQPPEE